MSWQLVVVIFVKLGPADFGKIVEHVSDVDTLAARSLGVRSR
jgi:hypothetical protein